MGSTDPNRALLERRSRSARAPRLEPLSPNTGGLGGLNQKMQPSPPLTLQALRIRYRWAQQNECKLTRGGTCILIFFSLLGKVYSFSCPSILQDKPKVQGLATLGQLQKERSRQSRQRSLSELSKPLIFRTPCPVGLRLQEKECLTSRAKKATKKLAIFSEPCFLKFTIKPCNKFRNSH